MKPMTSCLTVFICVFMLTACGGGTYPLTAPGDGSTPFGPALSTPPLPDLGRGIIEAFTGDEPHIDEGVVQSYGTVSPVERIDTTFDGDRLTIALGREDGTRTVLDTRDPRTISYTHDVYEPAYNPIRERPAVEGYAARTEADGSVIGTYTFVEWNNGDATDYLAGGYWFQAHPVEQGVQFGVFVDSPVFDSDVALELPVTGTATYKGYAAGVHVYLGGEDSFSGTFGQGEFEGRAILTADFDRSEISGTIDQIHKKFSTYFWPNGVKTFVSTESIKEDLTLDLHPVTFGGDGTFSGSKVTINDSGIEATTTGSWGGQFGNVPDSQGNPLAVGGTFSAKNVTPGGENSHYTGMFYGVTDPYGGNGDDGAVIQ